MTVELSVLPWPAAIVAANGELRDCNASWHNRFGQCRDLGRDFPEVAAHLRDFNAQRAEAPNSDLRASVLARAPGEIAPLRLRFLAMTQSPTLWLLIVEESDAELVTPTPVVPNEMRDVELAMDGVAMRLQARNWRAFFHNAAAGKSLIGMHGETLEVNRALCRLLDRSEQELLHLYARDLRHPDDFELVDQSYKSLIDGGPPIVGIEARYRHKNGSYLNCLLSLSLIRDSRHKPLYFAAEVEDITSRRRAEAQLRAQAQELERANSELTRSNAELERFAFVASHDLQEPLRKIRVFGDRLQTLTARAPRDPAFDADLVRYVGVMTGAAQRMQNLVDDLLAYGRLKRRDTPFVPVDLNVLWDELREEFETTLRESGAQLQVGALPTVRGNPSRLRQLFGNLLSNALKFRGEQPPHIVVRAVSPLESSHLAFHLATIEVEDNGIGFDEAYAESIFDVFARLHGRSRYPGTGIGLSICRRVAHEHGGEVRAFARAERGARFVITLEL